MRGIWNTKIDKDDMMSKVNKKDDQCWKISWVLENNLASLRVFEKLGFKKDGILRDFQYRDGHYINAFHLAILENEWSNLTKNNL